MSIEKEDNILDTDGIEELFEELEDKIEMSGSGAPTVGPGIVLAVAVIILR